MSITAFLRYQKKDRYGSEIFIASPKYDDEKAGFEKLKTLAGKVEDLNFGTFSPVYFNDNLDYCTIRCKFYKGMKLIERNIYEVKFILKQSERDENKYVNCHIDTIKLHKKAKPVDNGVVLDFGI